MFFNLEPQPVPNAYYPPPPNANFIQAPVVTPDPNYSLPVAQPQPQQRIEYSFLCFLLVIDLMMKLKLSRSLL